MQLEASWNPRVNTAIVCHPPGHEEINQHTKLIFCTDMTSCLLSEGVIWFKLASHSYRKRAGVLVMSFPVVLIISACTCEAVISMISVLSTPP